jgi:hypothetical protein
VLLFELPIFSSPTDAGAPASSALSPTGLVPLPQVPMYQLLSHINALCFYHSAPYTQDWSHSSERLSLCQLGLIVAG